MQHVLQSMKEQRNKEQGNIIAGRNSVHEAIAGFYSSVCFEHEGLHGKYAVYARITHDHMPQGCNSSEDACRAGGVSTVDCSDGQGLLTAEARKLGKCPPMLALQGGSHVQ